MLSRQDCKWLPGLARQPTAASSTVSGRFSGKKGHQHSGKGLQVAAGGGGCPPEWLSCFHVLPLSLSGSLGTAISVLSLPHPVGLFQRECSGPPLSLASLWSPMNFCSGGSTSISEACKCIYFTQPRPVLALFTEPLGEC